jgi:hypothetical protein
MNPSEKDYITLCKRLIEEKFQFETERGTLRQRDLEYLADCIEEKSAIKLSLSTLKRVWKKDYKQTPHPSTLQALVSVLDYKDWREFKVQQISASAVAITPHTKKRGCFLNRWVALPIAVALPIVVGIIIFHPGQSGKSTPIIKGPVTFTGNKTVSQGVPNTIIFNYDLSKVEGDSFFFQQSWNALERIKLDPQRHYFSNIYYYPGFHQAKLIVNDSILKSFPVHITTDGWMPIARYLDTDNMPVYIKKEDPVINGALHVTQNDLISSHVNFNKGFVVGYYNLRDFDNSYSDNFSLDTRIVCDSINTIACPRFELVVICETDVFFVRMVAKGCERDIALKMGEVYQDGSQNDLSAFGRNLYSWQRLQIQVARKSVTIYLDERPVYSTAFKNDFGKVVGLVYNFTGTGAVDYVKLKNGENRVIYEDNFDQ